jgi:hypothetical protein
MDNPITAPKLLFWESTRHEKHVLELFAKNDIWNPMWDEVRTYLSTLSDSPDKSRILLAIAHFKQNEATS